MNNELSPLSPAWWDARYQQGDTPWDQGVVAPEIENFVAEHPGRGEWALDIGCGTAVHSRELARHGYNVVGLDLSHSAVRKALKAAQAERLPWLGVQASATDIALLKQVFTVAIDVGCFHALDEAQQRAYARGLTRRLRRGGFYLLYVVHPRTSSDEAGPPGVAPEQVERVFAPGLRVVWREEGWQGERHADWWLWRKPA